MFFRTNRICRRSPFFPASRVPCFPESWCFAPTPCTSCSFEAEIAATVVAVVPVAAFVAAVVVVAAAAAVVAAAVVEGVVVVLVVA